MKGLHPLHRRSSGTAAFSLIELLVVLAVLLILTTMYWNHGPSKRDLELTSCRQNLEKIFLAMQIYANDNKEKFPVSTNALTSEDALAPLIPHYTSDTAIFICPATGQSELPTGKTFREWKISYAYYMGRRTTEADQALLSDQQVDASSKSKGRQFFPTRAKRRK